MPKPKYTLAVDIETFSPEVLDGKKGVGAYKYAAHPDFEILLIAYKIDDGPILLLDLDPADGDPAEIDGFIKALQDPAYLKTAFNAAFERACLSAYFKITLPPDQWECTQAKAYTCGMSGGLDTVAAVLGCGTKLSEGRNLIRYFCIPCKPTKVNGMRSRNLRSHDPAKWKQFEDYCIQDVKLESEVRKKLSGFNAGEMEKQLWNLDQKINDYGVRIDREFVENALAIDNEYADFLKARAIELTGLENPKSVKQLKKWLEQEIEEDLDKGIGAKLLPGILKKCKSDTAREVIGIRQRLSKSSTKKYIPMLRMAGPDQRLRGLLQYYGASRTGRWAGRIVQPHNLPKNDKDILPDIPLARMLVRRGDSETLDICYPNLPVILSQLIRTAFVPSPGRRFIVSDFSAVEARVIAWLAGETWRLEVFKTHGKIYEASACKMFSLTMDQITPAIRYKGKVSELSLGFQGSVGALIRMGALDMGLTEIELPGIVSRWRVANPNIVNLWEVLGSAAIEAVENPGVAVPGPQGISFQVKNNVLYITLPSGRKLCYIRPRMMQGLYGMTLTYEGIEVGISGKKWGRVETYGGKITENIVQAIARDLLAGAMLRLDAAGFDITLHVHDEAVLDVPLGVSSAAEVSKIMAEPVPWAIGLPLAAESFETDFYKKE